MPKWLHNLRPSTTPVPDGTQKRSELGTEAPQAIFEAAVLFDVCHGMVSACRLRRSVPVV
jgi:hypothetical protein